MNAVPWPPILVLGRDTCSDTIRSRAHLTAREIPYAYRNVEFDAEADVINRSYNDGVRVTPTILIGDPTAPTRVVMEPSDDELDAAVAEAARTSSSRRGPRTVRGSPRPGDRRSATSG